MFIIGYFLQALGTVLGYVIQIYIYIIVARAILSWVSPDPFNPIVRFITNVTDPVLIPLRRKLPLFVGGIDFSPIVLILGLLFLQIFVVQSLMRIAAGLVV